MNVLQRCLFLTCVFFIMCPKRGRFGGLSNAIEKTEKAEIKLNSNDKKAKLGSVNSLAFSEPGFNLTDDEMEKFKIWPQGIIPYFIDDYSFDKVLRDRIRGFLDNANSLTGLRFLELPRPPEDDISRWVFFINRRGQLDCADNFHKNFTTRGVQKVVLGYDCLDGRGVAEVVLALAGVPPQHNAPDRIIYVTIVDDSILPEKKYLFEELKDDEWLFFDAEYDFSSAGHYPFHKYTLYGGVTIRPKVFVNIPVGEGDGLSYNDVWKIRMLYNYISKKQQNVKLPECSKLYQPGHKFDSFQPDSYEEVTPRRKPSRYLGIKDDVDGQNLSDFESVDKKTDDGGDQESTSLKNNRNKETSKSKLNDQNHEKDLLHHKSDYISEEKRK